MKIMRLLLLFILVPIMEIALFIEVGGLLGLWTTLLIIILTAIFGTVLVKNQGIAVIYKIRNNLLAFEDPTESIAHGALILVSGILLLTPGFFTDIVGFMLLIPQLRGFVYLWIKSKLGLKKFSSRRNDFNTTYSDNFTIIEGEYSQKDD
tara:strand:+ start:1254 stop:1703 length:450 start_codon:yes stop_codon:yes gene_type:complete